VRHLDAGAQLDHFGGEMRRGSDTGRCEIELTGIGFGVRDQFGERIYRQGQRRDDQRRRRADDGNRLQRLQIVGSIRLQRRIGDEGGVRQQHRIAVRRRARDHVGADHAAGTGTVLGHDRLSQTFA
jgi:hypothetical protein